jgi:hypothetical protein
LRSRGCGAGSCVKQTIKASKDTSLQCAAFLQESMVDLHEKATVILFIVLRYNVFVIAVLEIANGLRPKFEAEDISHYSSHLFDCDMTVMFNDTLQSIRNRFLQTFSTITTPSFSSPLEAILADLSAVSAGNGTAAASPSNTTAICSSECPLVSG